MAARDREGSACVRLLQKLRDGQEDLRQSVRRLRKSPTRQESSKEGRKKRKLAVHRLLGDPLACVDNFPRKRARTVQLTPDRCVGLLKTYLL